MKLFAVVLGFAAIWVLISLVMAGGGPWADLAAHYAADQDFSGGYRLENRTLRFEGATEFENVIAYGVEESGLRMEVLGLYPGHEDLLIPWSEIEPRYGRGGAIITLRFRAAPDVVAILRDHDFGLLAKHSAGRLRRPPSAPEDVERR